MKCKNFRKRIRTKEKQIYFYCAAQKKEITLDECNKCPKFESREYKGLNKSNKPIKKKSAKLAKIERERDKGKTKKGYCQCCRKWSNRLDPHEVYGGSNRITSITQGFVKDICRICHDNEERILELRKEVQAEYEKTHTREEFIQLIGWSYLRD